MGILRFTPLCTLVLSLLLGLAAGAQLSARALRLQSEAMVLSKSEGQGLKRVMTYYPRGQGESEWTIRFQVMRAEGKDHVAFARAELAEALARKGRDRYAGALLLTTRSGQSVYLDQYLSEGDGVESRLTRYFVADDGLVIYRWTRRLPNARVPADAGARHLEIMRFIERERQKRVDLITDFATKRDIPLMAKDDPMGMKTLPAKPKSQP